MTNDLFGKFSFKDLFSKKVNKEKNLNVDEEKVAERTTINPEELNKIESSDPINVINPNVEITDVEETTSEGLNDDCPCEDDYVEEESHDVVNNECDEYIWATRDDVFKPSSDEGEPEFLPVDSFTTICTYIGENENGSMEDENANV